MRTRAAIFVLGLCVSGCAGALPTVELEARWSAQGEVLGIKQARWTAQGDAAQRLDWSVMLWWELVP
jgi:hypothetical protein